MEGCGWGEGGGGDSAGVGEGGGLEGEGWFERL